MSTDTTVHAPPYTPDVLPRGPVPPAQPAPPGRMRARLRDLAGPALFEAAFVVLGVVLAYAANEWREARLHRQEATAAHRAITAELRTNRAAVAAALAYHDGLLDSLGTHREAGTTPNPGTFTRGFVSPAQLSGTAWEVAAQTGVLSHMPYESVLGLSRTYAQQGRYEAQAQSVAQLIYAELYRVGPMEMAANSRNLASLIGAFTYRERALLAVYDSTLARERAPR